MPVRFTIKHALFSLILILFIYLYTSSSPSLPLSNYRGGSPWRTSQTISAQTIASTAFARVEFHTVQTESGKLVNDWIWLDIQDQVNILVRTAQDKFLVFRQSKYGLEGISYAVVGGLIEPGELPEQAAKRELLEELGMESKEWKFLGRFRTDVNRGGGYCSCFIAMNARRSNIHRISDDLEQQSPIELTRDELRELVLSGKFEEAKWSVTASLGLLYLESSPSK